MSVVFSGTNQGFFTSTGAAQILQLRSDVDWINVYNQTEIAAGASNTGLQFYWQRGMGQDKGLEYKSGISGSVGYGPVASFFGTTLGTGSLGNDYAATVAVRTAAGTGRLPFPRAGVSVPLVNGITAIDASSFNLAAVGTYEVSWSVQTTEVGQWQIELNGIALANTVLVDQNPTAGGHPVSGMFVITTTLPNSVLAIINPTGNSTALTITPADGAETHANSPTLTIAMIGGSVGLASPLSLVWLSSGGFSLINNTINIPGAFVATSAISGANPPVVSTASTAGLSTGSIVRIYNTPGALQLGSLDFTVGSVVANTSFTLAYMRAIAATAFAGNYAIIPFNPYFYPPVRIISKIEVNPANILQSIITLTVTHTFTVGQRVRLILPTVTMAAFGMPSLNDRECTIVAIGAADADSVTNTITVDVNSGGMTFAWPLTTDPAFTPPQVVPVGQDSGFTQFAAASYIGDSEINQGYIGISLAAGVNSPAGQTSDVIYWVAGKSFNT